MDVKRKGLFLLSISDSEYFNDSQGKIELVGCPQLGEDCKKHISQINKSFLSSDRFWRDKDYPQAIDELKSAFYTSNKFMDTSCTSCLELFHATIIRSLENIHQDLYRMSTGLFSRKRYQSSYELATGVLEEFKKAT
jgi:hypothetical protein